MARDKTCDRRRRVHLPHNAVRQIAIGAPVQVDWLDIVTEPDWMSKEAFVTREPTECILVGIWMKPGARCIHIASNMSEEDCDGTTIPVGCVLRVKELGHARGNAPGTGNRGPEKETHRRKV